MEEGFLPAAPREGACRYCDYRIVCGPREERRIARKPQDRLDELTSCGVSRKDNGFNRRERGEAQSATPLHGATGVCTFCSVIDRR